MLLHASRAVREKGKEQRSGSSRLHDYTITLWHYYTITEYTITPWHKLVHDFHDSRDFHDENCVSLDAVRLSAARGGAGRSEFFLMAPGRPVKRPE